MALYQVIDEATGEKFLLDRVGPRVALHAIIDHRFTVKCISSAAEAAVEALSSVVLDDQSPPKAVLVHRAGRRDITASDPLGQRLSARLLGGGDILASTVFGTEEVTSLQLPAKSFGVHVLGSRFDPDNPLGFVGDTHQDSVQEAGIVSGVTQADVVAESKKKIED